MDGIGGNRLRGHLEGMVLSVLADAEAHGYEVLQRLEAAGEGALRLKEGTLYPVLYRLEAEGLVKGRWEDSRNGRRGPRRRLYRLTAKGKRELGRVRTDWTRFVRVVGGILEAGT